MFIQTSENAPLAMIDRKDRCGYVDVPKFFSMVCVKSDLLWINLS